MLLTPGTLQARERHRKAVIEWVWAVRPTLRGQSSSGTAIEDGHIRRDAIALSAATGEGEGGSANDSAEEKSRGGEGGPRGERLAPPGVLRGGQERIAPPLGTPLHCLLRRGRRHAGGSAKGSAEQLALLALLGVPLGAAAREEEGTQL